MFRTWLLAELRAREPRPPDRRRESPDRPGPPSASAGGLSPVDGPDPPLTASELAVLARLDGDGTLREIGAGLYLSVNTVKSHVRSIYRKLGVDSRQTALARARDLGVLGPFEGA